MKSFPHLGKRVIRGWKGEDPTLISVIELGLGAIGWSKELPKEINCAKEKAGNHEWIPACVNQFRHSWNDGCEPYKHWIDCCGLTPDLLWGRCEHTQRNPDSDLNLSSSHFWPECCPTARLVADWVSVDWEYSQSLVTGPKRYIWSRNKRLTLPAECFSKCWTYCINYFLVKVSICVSNELLMGWNLCSFLALACGLYSKCTANFFKPESQVWYLSVTMWDKYV